MKNKKAPYLGGNYSQLKNREMAVTIFEALKNANYNLDNVKIMGFGIIPLIKAQLNNAVTLLEKGYDLDTEVEPLIKKYGSVENVPENE